MAGRNKTISEKYNSPFATNIRSLMEERGITQDELAQAVGRTRQTISQYVNGISEPGYDTLVKIADFFNVSADFLLGRTDAKTTDSTTQSIVRSTGLSEHSVARLLTVARTEGHLFSRWVNDILDIDGPIYQYLGLVHIAKNRTYHKMPDGVENRLLELATLKAIGNEASEYAQTLITQEDYMRFLTLEIGNAISDGLRKKYIPGYQADWEE
mgnify:CR=1 FL=1